MTATITLTGRSQLGKALGQVSHAVMYSDGAKRINYSAALELQRIIRAGAPTPKGITAAKGWPSIAQSVLVKQQGMPAWVKYDNQKNPVGLWLEHGTAERKTAAGWKTGRMTANNWWSNARNSARTPVRRVLRAGYKALVEGAASRAS